MVHFNPVCHTALGHLFHPKCQGLSESQQKLYSAGALFLRVMTGGLAHSSHDKNFHSPSLEGNSSLHERVSLLSAPQMTTRSNYSVASIANEVSERCEKLKGVDFNTREGWKRLLECCEEEGQNLVNLLCNIDSTKINPYQDKSVIQQFDLNLRLSFLAGVQNLEEVKKDPDYQKGQQSNVERLFATVITEQRGHVYYRIFFFVPSLYEMARGSLTYQTYGESLLRTFLHSFYERNKALFYKEGTLQSEWRNLYNHYCQIVYAYATVDDFEKTDKRFSIHTKEDSHPCAYTWNVGTAPS